MAGGQLRNSTEVMLSSPTSDLAQGSIVAIPGLDLDLQTEQVIWDAFDGWADHFRRRLASGGLPSLLADYEELVRSLETQSCSHEPGGRRNTGAEWRSCCGTSYEYLNDLTVRDALQVIIDSTPAHESKRLKTLIEPLDSRLRFQLFGSTDAGRATQDAYVTSGVWWRGKLPDVIEP